jgi:hypothetical protein
MNWVYYNLQDQIQSRDLKKAEAERMLRIQETEQEIAASLQYTLSMDRLQPLFDL